MKTGWILCDKGKTGTYRQCLALAQLLEKELGIHFIYKPIRLKPFWRFLPPHFAVWHKKPYNLNVEMEEGLHPPYPDVVIAAGRQAVTAAMALRKYSFNIVLQHPKINPHFFNLVIPPYHDNLKSENVLATQGALHPIRIDELRLLREKLEKDGTYKPLNSPRIAVLIGGDNKYYKYTDAFAAAFSERLRYMVAEDPKYQGGSLLITPSRRTRPEILAKIEESLDGLSYELWQGEGDNPYMNYLAIADAIVVTGDSVSMMSEACLMGKPIYIAEVPIKNQRFKKFINSLFIESHAQSFWQPFATKGFLPLDELDRVGKQVVGLLKK